MAVDRVDRKGLQHTWIEDNLTEIPCVLRAGWEVLFRITSRLGDCMSTFE